ncbi:MAG: porin family protein [Bacteroidota bacterium]
MKKTLVFVAFAWIGMAASAQSGSGFGIKGGLNYGGNGDYFDSATNAFEDPDSNLGYHIGLFAKVGNRIYVRPELMYTRITSGYNDGDFKMDKLDAPVLLGLKVIGPLNVFAGPAFQYILDTDFDGLSLGDVENDFSVGLHIGVGVNLGKLGVDLRYERGFNENEISIINANNLTTGDRLDTRPDQLIVSLSLKLY